MKLYYHPVSTTSRPIMLLAAESGLELEYQVVDLFGGEHLQPGFEKINPSRLVPVLEAGDFRLTESSAILKYLADNAGSPRHRARDR
jgi:glutathione S-transferase